jgi:hypothetical protein
MADHNNAELATILQDYVPRADYEAALDGLNQAISERDEHRAAAEKHTGRLGELEKKLRGKTWREAYSKIAKDLKVDAKFEDDVYDLLKLDPDADEPDEKGLRRTLEKFLDGKKHFQAAEAPAPKQIPAGEGFGRGRSVAPGEPELRVSREQRNSAIWMRDNQSRMLEAKRAGVLVLDD